MYYLLGAFALFFGEERIKRWVETHFTLNEEKPVLKKHLIFTRHHNYGFVHNRRSEHRGQVLVVSLVGLFLVVGNGIYVFFSGLSHGLKAGMMLLMAGGLSNAYDRIKRHYVVDYFIINKGRLKKTIFNLADILLFLGAVVCAAASLLEERK